MTNSFLLKIQSPFETLFEGAVVRITIRTELGYLGLLKDHSPILAALKAGNFQVNLEDGTTLRGFIEKGMLFFQNNEAIILSNHINLKDSADFNVFEVPEFKELKE